MIGEAFRGKESPTVQPSLWRNIISEKPTGHSSESSTTGGRGVTMREAVADMPVLRTYFGFSTLANCEDMDVCALDLKADRARACQCLGTLHPR